MTMRRIVILDDIERAALTHGPWSRLGAGWQVDAIDRHLEGDDLVEALRDAEVIVTMRERTPLGREQIAAAGSLRLLVTTGMRNAAIDVAAAKERGIVVCGTRSSVSSAAELAWALILASARRIVESAESVRSGEWGGELGVDLAGRTLGIVGLGGIGQRVARVARAFDMDVLAWSHNLAAETAAEHGARRVDKAELFAAADIVTIHLRLSDRTVGLVGAAELAAMKDTAILVNTSRGPIVREAALLAALQAGSIGGAALDVYDTEPLPPDHPFRTGAGLLATPHIGYVTAGNFGQYFTDAVENIAAWEAGEPVRVLSA